MPGVKIQECDITLPVSGSLTVDFTDTSISLSGANAVSITGATVAIPVSAVALSVIMPSYDDGEGSLQARVVVTDGEGNPLYAIANAVGGPFGLLSVGAMGVDPSDDPIDIRCDIAGNLNTAVVSLPVSGTLGVSATTGLTATTIEYPSWDYQELAYDATPSLTSVAFSAVGNSVLNLTLGYNATGALTSVEKS